MDASTDLPRTLDDALRFLTDHLIRLPAVHDLAVKRIGQQTVITYYLHHDPCVKFLNFGLANQSHISPGLWRRLRLGRVSNFFLYNEANFFPRLMTQGWAKPIHVPVTIYQQPPRDFWEARLLTHIGVSTDGDTAQAAEHQIVASLTELLAWPDLDQPIDLVELDWMKSLIEPPIGTDYITLHCTRPPQVVYTPARSVAAAPPSAEPNSSPAIYFPIVVYQLPNDPTWYAHNLALDGFLADGLTPQQATANLRDWLADALATYYFPMFDQHPDSTSSLELNRLFRSLTRPPQGTDWLVLEEW